MSIGGHSDCLIPAFPFREDFRYVIAFWIALDCKLVLSVEMADTRPISTSPPLPRMSQNLANFFCVVERFRASSWPFSLVFHKFSFPYLVMALLGGVISICGTIEDSCTGHVHLRHW